MKLLTKCGARYKNEIEDCECINVVGSRQKNFDEKMYLKLENNGEY